MTRPFSRLAVAVFASLSLIGSVVACSGGGSVPPAPGSGASGSAGNPVLAAAAATPGGTFAYQNIRPLVLYSGSGLIDFLVTSVTTAGTFQPPGTGPLATQEFDITMPCSASQSVAATSSERHTAAVTASATPPPTPQPTNLPVSNCLIVAYANGGTTAIPVTGFASINGNDLIFAPTSPGLTYTLGVTYTFYVAIATPATPAPTATPSPSPAPTATPACHGGGDGDSRDRDSNSRDHNGDNSCNPCGDGHGDQGHHDRTNNDRGNGHGDNGHNDHQDCDGHGDGHDHGGDHGDGGSHH